MDIYHESHRMGGQGTSHGWGGNRKRLFQFLLYLLSVYLYRDDVMSGILVPFVKQVVGYFVFQTEVLDGLTLWYHLRLITDEFY